MSIAKYSATGAFKKRMSRITGFHVRVTREQPLFKVLSVGHRSKRIPSPAVCDIFILFFGFVEFCKVDCIRKSYEMITLRDGRTNQYVLYYAVCLWRSDIFSVQNGVDRARVKLTAFSWVFLFINQLVVYFCHYQQMKTILGKRLIPISRNSGVYSTTEWKASGTSIFCPVMHDLFLNIHKYEQITTSQGDFFTGDIHGNYEKTISGK